MSPRLRMAHLGAFSGISPALQQGLGDIGIDVQSTDFSSLCRAPQALAYRAAAITRGRLKGVAWTRTPEWSAAIGRRVRGFDETPMLFMQTVLACEVPADRPYVVFTDRAGNESLIDDPAWSSSKDPKWLAIEARFLKQAQRVFVMGPSTASYLESIGVRPESITVTASGPNARLPRRRDRSSEPCRRVLFLGKEWERKGGAAVLAAVQAVRDAGGSDVELHVIGCTPEVPSWVTVHGRIDPTDLGEHLDAANVLAMPSLSEPFGVVYVEALLAGIPVLGSSVGNVEWLVADAGIFPDPTDRTAVSAGLVHLIENYPEFARNAFARGAAHEIAWSWSHIAEGVASALGLIPS